ncbi:MAG: hypothetical protein V8S14_06485 [Lachnospiraceae bacterium]
MSKLFKFMKPYAGVVAAILCILVVQAYCDLSLPTYTSDIVNVGIQQNENDEKIRSRLVRKIRSICYFWFRRRIKVL